MVCTFALLDWLLFFPPPYIFQGIQLNKKNSAAIQSQMSCFYYILQF